MIVVINLSKVWKPSACELKDQQVAIRE